MINQLKLKQRLNLVRVSVSALPNETSILSSNDLVNTFFATFTSNFSYEFEYDLSQPLKHNLGSFLSSFLPIDSFDAEDFTFYVINKYISSGAVSFFNLSEHPESTIPSFLNLSNSLFISKFRRGNNQKRITSHVTFEETQIQEEIKENINQDCSSSSDA